MKTQYESIEDWREEGRRLFGNNMAKWRFKCPNCGIIYEAHELLDAGAKQENCSPPEECVGRYDKGRGCNWAAYGFLDICKVHVSNGEWNLPVFEFAPLKDSSKVLEAK